MVNLPTNFEGENKRNSMSTTSTIPATQSSTTSGGSTVSLSAKVSAKENEWVAPQFHRKVHVNNRIYIEGAGIEKLGYERLTEYFSRWGKVYNVELKVNNRDGRRQKKVYGFVTFSEENDAQACIEAAKAGIEIEPGRPLSVRSAFFMPRRNSFESEKVSHQNWQNSSAPSEPTIHSRSPSPDFTTGEWKPEMANQVNGHYKQPMTVEEQAKKLFEIFQNLPEHAQHRILQILMAQKYQEQQLAAIKESRNQVIDDLSSGTVPSTNPDLSGLFGNLHLGGEKSTTSNGNGRLENGLGIQGRNNNGMNENGFGSSGGNGFSSSKPPITLPRFVPTQERSNGNSFPQQSQQQQQQVAAIQGNGTSGSALQGNVTAQQRSNAAAYGRQYSDSVFEQANGNGGYSNSFNMPQSSAGRPIKKIHNDNGLSLNIPDSFGASSPNGAWQMPNSPPNDDFFMAPGRNQRLTDSFSQY